jgi:hypothetical protein
VSRAGHKARRKVDIAIIVALIGFAGSMATALVARGSEPPVVCATRDMQIVQLVEQHPRLAPILAEKGDGLDSRCGTVKSIVRATLAKRR